ncbi:heavy metal translocating P-type ATPase [Chengkuizengella sediminis]|uniref:heavy metal translocating P-type ATPase n=1 Tax=Chengkuizengella sediminis TaxID=1885917 RepID=UPI00138A2B99|nr:heavy metal translocating P-type ATPase [Chengkuizengella sediminis]NDI36152.1 copper-translocating P-type ATPase [Chengkuizengella sediminis]
MSLLNEKEGQVTIQISGMTCGNCAARIEKSLSKIESIHEAKVNLAIERASVRFNQKTINIDQIIHKIEKLGFGANIYKDILKKQIDFRKIEYRSLRNRFVISAILTIPLLWTMFTHFSFTSSIWVPELFMNSWFQLMLATPVQFMIGMPFYFSAFHAVKNKTANMDVLVVLGTSSAYFYSHYLTINSISSSMENHHVPLYFETSSMIITVVLLGKLLELRARSKTLQVVHRLQDIGMKETTIIRDNISMSVPAEKIQVGDIMIIHAGEYIPVDGKIVEGNSVIDESMITGESIPIEKKQGDTIISGSINMNGLLKIVATRTGQQSTIAQINKFIEEAQVSKPPIQRAADRFAGIFVPVIVSLSLFTFFTWYYVIKPGDFALSLEHAIAVMVIACPCALGLATPTSIMVATGRAAENGILFKEGSHIEALDHGSVIFLDKTGTITEGKPSVTKVISTNVSESYLLCMAAAVETYSEHPMAKAIVKEAKNKRLILPDSHSIITFPGYGISGNVEGSKVIIGTKQLLENQGVSINIDNRRVQQLQEQGKSVLFVSIQQKFSGMICVSDTLKQNSIEAIRLLKLLRFKVVMVTGDHDYTSKSIAKEVGIKHIYSNALPKDKGDLVRKWQQKGENVVFVGDGMNDAPALAAANIGFAMGTGTDLTNAAADVNLMKNDLIDVSKAIKLSRKTMRNIKQNLSFALLYNLIAIPFAIMGLLEPWMAGTAMALSSVSVVSNSLRLQKLKLN